MDAPRRHPLVDFFAVAVRPRTYGALAYLWLGFPLGLAWFVALTVGFALGFGLAILWIGFFILPPRSRSSGSPAASSGSSRSTCSARGCRPVSMRSPLPGSAPAWGPRSPRRRSGRGSSS